MGTYTTNKNLFMPTVGETGWGTLVNNNFTTIDTFLKPITVSGSTYTFTGNHVGNQSGGSVSATSITNNGTLTQKGTSTFTGKITANGGIGTTSLTTSSTITSTGKITGNGGIAGTTGTFSGAVTGASFNGFIPRVYTFKIDGTGNTSFTGQSITSINSAGTSDDTSTVSCYIDSTFTTDFGTKSGTAQFLYEDNNGRLYQFTNTVLPTSGIKYGIRTRNNATLKINNITATNNTVTICTADDIKNIITKPFSYTITSSGIDSGGGFLRLVFENTASSKKYIYMI